MTHSMAAAGLAICALCAPLPALSQVTTTPDPVGDALAYLVPIAAAGLTFYENDREGLKQLAFSFALAQGTSEVLKHVVDSPRPDGTGHGFPSGHASSVFSSAAFVHRRYGVREAIPFYALATVTGWERVHHNHHFVGQVVGGAVIGVASSFLLTQSRDGRFALAIGYGPEGVSVQYLACW